MKFGIYANGIAWSYVDLRRVWVEADRLGVDRRWIMDNTVGPVPVAPETPVFDPWTVLPALAEATERIRIGTLVTPCSRRHPAVLAKMASVLDVVSGGRSTSAWDRGTRTGSSSRGVCRSRPRRSVSPSCEKSWRCSTRCGVTSTRPSMASTTRSTLLCASRNRCSGRIRRSGSGSCSVSKVMPRVAAEYADGVSVYTGDDGLAAELLDIVDERCRENGRDPGTLQRSRSVVVTLTEDDVDPDELVVSQAAAAGLRREDLADYYATFECHIVGPPEVIATDLRRRVSDLGFDQTVLRLDVVGDDAPPSGSPESFVAGMRIFAQQVAPSLRAVVGVRP